MTDASAVAVESDAPKRAKSKRGRRVLGVILVLLLLLFGLAAYLFFRLVASPASQAPDDEIAGITWVRSIYGIDNTEEGQFSLTQDAVPGPGGSVWVTDSRKQAVMEFTPDGRYVRSERGPDDALLFAPARFAIGPDGKFYVCDPPTDVVRVLDSNGNEAGSFGVPEPVSIAVSEDMIVVGSVSGFAICDPTGKPLHIIGSRGKGDDQFDYVHGVAIAEDGTIYVSDSFNNRISAYTPDGKRLWMTKMGKSINAAEVGSNKQLSIQEAEEQALSGEQALQVPLDITIDGAGRIVAADLYECALAVIDPKDGSVIGKYGAPGGDDGSFFYPVSVGYDAERDWFTVADSLNHRVQIVRIPGSSSGSDALSAVRRALSGPLRACLFPLILLLIALVAWVVYRVVRKRREQQEAAEGGPADAAEGGVELGDGVDDGATVGENPSAEQER